MITNNIISKKKRNIYASFYSKDYSSKFFFRSILHHVISLEIYENNYLSGISFEKICTNIPKSIGSRSTIQSILNEALERKILVKKLSNHDKRVKNYFLSDSFFYLINSWIKSEKFYFTNTIGG
tara:strand:+ start:123 stop:494 length:372 start_codon:yes stop_codon:yes gene_type:complete